MFKVQLIVRPRDGVRDPQGEAVEESLRGLGYQGVAVVSVGRCLRVKLSTDNENEARATAHDMCKRVLVNPNLETYDLTIERE